MKKLLLFVSILATISSNAQTWMIPTTHKTFIMKYTADWCGPCGAWGWAEFGTIVDDCKSGSLKAVAVAFHESSDSAQLNVSAAFGNAFTNNLDSGVPFIPTFCVGKLNMAQSSLTAVEGQANTVTSSAAEVNAGFLPTWSANSVSVQVKTQFFTTATGSYSVGVYMYEEGIVTWQNNQGLTASHHNIMRESIGMSSAFGSTLSGTSFTSASTFTNTFTLTLKPNWNQAKISMFTIVWKKNGTKWDVANANDVASWPTSVNGVNSEVISGIYPNPANNMFTIVLNKPVKDCIISMYDITGKKVADLYSGDVGLNTVALRLQRPANTPNGIYMVNINSNEGSQTVKLTLQ